MGKNVMATIAITKSNELAKNVGNTVASPKGIIFRIDLWQTAKQHGLNAGGSAYGSRMKVTMGDGAKREFFSSSYKGSETLTNFYKEVGLETSGKSGETKTRKPFGQRLEELFDSTKEGDKTQTLLNFLLSAKDCPKWLKDAKEAEEKRLKEEEERKLKEAEEKEFERMLKARGFSLKDLKKRSK